MQALNGRLSSRPPTSTTTSSARISPRSRVEVARGERASPARRRRGRAPPAGQGRGARARLPGCLRAQGREVVEITMDDRWDFDAAAAARTVEAMRAGADVISQATFVERPLARPRRLPDAASSSRSKLGAWSYEALDAKLARAEKPTYVLQLCFYSDGIAGVQGDAAGAHARACSASASSARCATTISPPTTGACARGFEAAVGSAASDRAVSGRALRAVRASARCATALAAPRITSCWWRASAASRSCACATAGCRRWRRSRERAGDATVPQVAPHAFETLRDQAALQLERRTTGRLDWHRDRVRRRAAASSCCRGRRRAT